MGLFLIKRIAVMALTALVLTFVVFFLTNLYPNLEKLAKFQGSQRMTDAEVSSYLQNNGYLEPIVFRYGQWLGVMPGWQRQRDDGTIRGRCVEYGMQPEEIPKFCGLLQGSLGYSTVAKVKVSEIIWKRLATSGVLMFWVMIVMIPMALVVGVLAGMREGSKTDRSLSTFAITTTATPEYISGVVLVVVFASSAVGLKWFKGSAASAVDGGVTFDNFTLPVMTMAFYGMGYIARMTRASMAEVMTSQFIRTARLKGVPFHQIVLKHALRNALIAPFTVIMLQFPWLLTGVVIVETLFNYKGFGWTLVQAAENNDIELLISCSIAAVVVVLVTQLISDIGYVYLNPRIRVS